MLLYSNNILLNVHTLFVSLAHSIFFLSLFSKRTFPRLRCSDKSNILKMYIWISTEKKKAQPESWQFLSYLVDKTEDLSLGDSLSALRGCSEERRSQDVQEFLQQRPGSQNIKTSLLMKENRTAQVKEFSTFLCRGRCKSLASLKSSSLWEDLSSLGPTTCALPS